MSSYFGTASRSIAQPALSGSGTALPPGYTREQWDAMTPEQQAGALAAQATGRVGTGAGGVVSNTTSDDPFSQTATGAADFVGGGNENPDYDQEAAAEFGDSLAAGGGFGPTLGGETPIWEQFGLSPQEWEAMSGDDRRALEEKYPVSKVDADGNTTRVNNEGSGDPLINLLDPTGIVGAADAAAGDNGGGDGGDVAGGGFDITDPLGYKAAAREEWEHEQKRLQEQKDLAAGARGYAEDKTTGIMDIIGAGGDARTEAVTGGYDQARGDIAGGLDTATGQVSTGYDSGKERLAGDVGTSRIDQLLSGELSRDEAFAGFEEDPGYQFRKQQGEQALMRSQATRGGRLAPAALKELMDFNSGLASQEYGNFANRRMGLNQMRSGLSQGADTTDLSKAGTLADFDVGEGSTLAGLTTDAAGQQAGFDVGQGQSLSNIIGDTTGMQVDAQGNLINTNTQLANTTIGNVGGQKGPGMAAAGSATNQSILDAIIGLWGG